MNSKNSVRVALNKEPFELSGSVLVTIEGASGFYSNPENELVVTDPSGEDLAIFANGEWIFAEKLSTPSAQEVHHGWQEEV